MLPKISIQVFASDTNVPNIPNIPIIPNIPYNKK